MVVSPRLSRGCPEPLSAGASRGAQRTIAGRCVQACRTARSDGPDAPARPFEDALSSEAQGPEDLVPLPATDLDVAGPGGVPAECLAVGLLRRLDVAQQELGFRQGDLVPELEVEARIGEVL